MNSRVRSQRYSLCCLSDIIRGGRTSNLAAGSKNAHATGMFSLLFSWTTSPLTSTALAASDIALHQYQLMETLHNLALQRQSEKMSIKANKSQYPCWVCSHTFSSQTRYAQLSPTMTGRQYWTVSSATYSAVQISFHANTHSDIYYAHDFTRLCSRQTTDRMALSNRQVRQNDKLACMCAAQNTKF